MRKSAAEVDANVPLLFLRCGQVAWTPGRFPWSGGRSPRGFVDLFLDHADWSGRRGRTLGFVPAGGGDCGRGTPDRLAADAAAQNPRSVVFTVQPAPAASDLPG